MLGKTLAGRYRIDRLLGTGGMGSVYAAEDLHGGGTVAVKVIHRHLSEGTAVVQRFAREARAAESIDTPHIARCFDTGADPDDGSPYMVLEYLVGEDLQHLLRRLGPLKPEVALRIAAQACLGVQKAHEAGVVHRDIKPANIFLSRAEGGARTVKVLDFGVAKILRDVDALGEGSTAGLTRTGSMLGSPLYMSPEQARSVKNVDHRSDVWSLGVVLYQSVAGRTPHQDISGLGDLILALCSELPPPVQTFAPWVAPEIAALVDRALRVVPDERFQSVGEMLDALRPLLPDGTELRDEMLEGLDEATHDHVAAAYVRTEAAPPSQPRPRAAVEAATAAPSSPPPSRGAEAAVATTGPGVAESADRRPAPAAAPRPLSLLAVAIACVVAGGGAVYAFTRPTAAPVSPAAVTASATAPAPLATGPAPGPSETAPAPPPTASETASARHAPPAIVAGPLPSAAAPRGRAAPSASAPRVAPLDYSSFGGRK